MYPMNQNQWEYLPNFQVILTNEKDYEKIKNFSLGP